MRSLQLVTDSDFQAFADEADDLDGEVMHRQSGPDSEWAEGLAMITAGLEMLETAMLAATRGPACPELVDAVEEVGRELDALRWALLDSVDRSDFAPWRGTSTDARNTSQAFVHHVLFSPDSAGRPGGCKIA